jgi:serine/threonine-protein kinase
MQMTVFGSAGQLVAERGPLRVVTLPVSAGSPVQVLVTNEGVSSGLLTLSCRADRPRPAEPLAAPDQRPPQQTETPETLPAPVNDADVAPEPAKPEKKPTPETPPNLNQPNFDAME